jgi:predicted transcriptional regulator
MQDVSMTQGERKLADLIWDNEPVRSGDLVSMCFDRFDWKKSTTYTVLKKIIELGIFQNEDSVVTSKISRSEYEQNQSECFLDKHFGGSLPKFLASFAQRKKYSEQEIEEMIKLIREYPEE